MVTPDSMQAARLALLSAAIQALMREACEDGYDEIAVTASVDGDIDLQYLAKGMPMGGQSL